VQPFRLGLNMSGTISAGAYTAGVVDFLIEAMDSWYAERKLQVKRHRNKHNDWDIPPHEMQLAVISGASGGGIVAGLAAAALVQEFHGVRTQSPPPGIPLNLLYKAWVTGIDIRALLSRSDLDQPSGRVASILNSNTIRDLASTSFFIENPRPQRREWIRDGLKVILTLTNLRGVPYALEPQTDADSARVLFYADRRQFEVLWQNQPSGGETWPLSAFGGAAWGELGSTAVATSALPAVLAPQVLGRIGAEYNHRMWSITQDRAKAGPDGDCECVTSQPMPPEWNVPDEQPFDTLNVDGGVTNNSPFDCARLELASLPPANSTGHNAREPQLADRFVVSIAPLATAIPAELPAPPSSDLASLIGRCMTVLLNQSRIEGENLKLTSDPMVFSRWVIAPTTETSGREPLAGSLLGGFNAFLAQLFREHDYQLGRRNCQRFLTAYFGVPQDNVLIQQSGLSVETQKRLDRTFGFDGPTRRLIPLIPVLPELQPEVTVVPNTIAESTLSELAHMATDRLASVLRPLVLGHNSALLTSLAFDAVWALAACRIREALLKYTVDELSRAGFLTGSLGESALLEEIRALRSEIASLK
jgi:hypothetical protein